MEIFCNFYSLRTFIFLLHTYAPPFWLSSCFQAFKCIMPSLTSALKSKLQPTWRGNIEIWGIEEVSSQNYAYVAAVVSPTVFISQSIHLANFGSQYWLASRIARKTEVSRRLNGRVEWESPSQLEGKNLSTTEPVCCYQMSISISSLINFYLGKSSALRTMKMTNQHSTLTLCYSTSTWVTILTLTKKWTRIPKTLPPRNLPIPHLRTFKAPRQVMPTNVNLPWPNCTACHPACTQTPGTHQPFQIHSQLANRLLTFR